MIKILVRKASFVLSLVFFLLSFGSTSSAQSRVTEAFLKADDGRMSGNCPMRVVFNGHITVDGPVTVIYTFTRSDGATAPTYKLEFQQAGTQSVTTDWTLGDERDLPAYSGWQAIKIISPDKLESSHETGAFSIACSATKAETGKQINSNPIAGNVKGSGVSVFANPGGRNSSSTPAVACYAVTLNGFTVNHATADDALRRDGTGDEVYLQSPTSLRFDSRGNAISSAIGGFSIVYGERRSPDERGRYQAGNATPNGGFQTGDNFPASAPWRRDGATSRGLVIPYVFYEGAVRPGELLIIIPSLWEWDNSDNRLNDRNTTQDYLDMLRDLRSHVSSALSQEGYEEYVRRELSGGGVPVVKTFSELGLARTLEIELGAFSPGNRPIGMRLQRDHTDRPVFDPQVIFLTSEAAEYMTRNNAFRLGPGVMPLRYRDDVDLEGDYTLYLQTDHADCTGDRP